MSVVRFDAPGRKKLLAGAILATATIAAYWKVPGLLFINYDDPTYVTSNLRVQSGLSLGGIAWAFKSTEAANWHPLTWLSHMVDYQLYGPDPAGHHLTSLLLHAANVLLLFYILQLLTGATWRSCMVAALFAVHPINVESVAWIAERKNVLSTFFWLLTLLAYVYYASKPNWKRYLLVAGLFICGLMSKPMLVTLPFTLLLLDYWPLARFRARRSDIQGSGPQSTPATKPSTTLKKHESTRKEEAGSKYEVKSTRALVVEKVPLLVLAAISSLITIIAQKSGGAVSSILATSVRDRLCNAVVSYSLYIEEMFWPKKLAVFYPYSRLSLTAASVGLSAALLAALTVLAILVRNRSRFFMAGWFWYLGTLVPVIGFIQVGLQSHADRYAYVPLIGVFIIIVWGVWEGAKRLRPGLASWLAVPSILIVLVLAFVTSRQLNGWHDSISLFQHAASVTAGNYIAYTNLGEALAGEGKVEEAERDFETAIQINPDFDQAQHNLGMALVQQGKLDDAVAHFKKAIEINPKFTDAYNKLGATLAREERYDEAAPYLYEVIKLDPDYVAAYANLGALLEKQGKSEEALEVDYRALRITSAHPAMLRGTETSMMAAQINCRVGELLARKGSFSQALEYYKEALRLKPDYQPARQGINAVLDSLERSSSRTEPRQP